MKQRQKEILKIGVTGGIGSGKSEVCALFARLGIPILSADEIAREISATHPDVRRKIVNLFGTSSYLPDGTLNRSYLASRVFTKKQSQKKLEMIVHPRVEREMFRRIKELRQRGEKIVIVEAALIYEAGLDKSLDVVVVVDADVQVRIDRVRKRDVVSEEDVRRRIVAQLDTGEKVQQADYVIRNDGTLEELASNVKFLHSLFQQLSS